MQDKHGLLSAPIPKVLRQMTIPMIFGMISILMFNLVDTFFISLLGTQALASISYTFPVTFALNCITMGMGVGLSTNIAHLLGQKKTIGATRFATHGLLLTVVLITLASGIGLMTIQPIFSLLGASPELIPAIDEYMHIWYLSIPLLAIPMIGNSVIRATGDTRTPATIMVLAGVINGVLDPLLIFGWGPFPELGIQGAAIASALSWLGACLWSLYILTQREPMLAPPHLSCIVEDCKQILRIATPAALSNSMIPLSGALLMIIMSRHGTAAVAAYGAAQRIESILILVLMSLASALTPFIAQNLGAEKHKRSFTGLFISMRFALVFQMGVFIAMVPLSIPIASLFSQEQSVKELLWHYLLVVPFSYGFQGIAMILVSGLNALHQPLKAFQWSFMRLFLFTLPSAWLGSYWFGTKGIFVGIALGNIIVGVLGYLYALKLRRKYLHQTI
ncbi:MATE family efflux transporter [Vibrio zhanjiangensis]|uniref:Multidrug resistance protein NorM n=1 Tax=Vibrio zhanjiangensis TaxID=1046128 RepID=A0ABQ6EXZ0_9VIBR|nr:MATE family efflux transporter [Vibrio zhanjiangensis]GLT17916.1 MATE family efflux transporter [Vibrio zhanjiangensis]